MWWVVQDRGQSLPSEEWILARVATIDASFDSIDSVST